MTLNALIAIIDPPVPLEERSYGIYIGTFSHNIGVQCNHIEGESTNNDVVGIYNNNSSSNFFHCNEIETVKTGALFTDICTSTKFRANTFKDNEIGLMLDETIMGFGIKKHRGNKWLGNFTNGARYDGLVSNLPQYAFFVDPNDGAELLPPNLFPSAGWFFTEPGLTYECPITCESGVEPELTSTDVEVAKGTLEPHTYIAAQKWTASKRLYRKIEDNNFLGIYTEIDSFYNANTSTSIGSFTNVEKAIEEAQRPDSLIQLQLDANHNQFIYFMDTISLIDKALETATGQDSLDLIDAKVDFSDQMYALALQHDSLVFDFKTQRNNEYDLIIPINNAVNDTTLIESNTKSYNDIYLNKLGRGNDSLTTTELTELFNIANQCLYSGGDIVSLARLSYMSLVDSFFYFDDAVLCTQQSNSIAPSEISEGKNLSVNSSDNQIESGEFIIYPNPTNNTANLLLKDGVFKDGIFTLFNINGKKVLDFKLSAEQQKYKIDTSKLSEGIYICKVFIDGIEKYVDKLSILKE